MAINFNKAEFVLSAVRAETFIRDGKPQVTFAGRSNVGKSSVINRLLISTASCTSPTCPATATPRSPRRSATAGAA